QRGASSPNGHGRVTGGVPLVGQVKYRRRKNAGNILPHPDAKAGGLERIRTDGLLDRVAGRKIEARSLVAVRRQTQEALAAPVAARQGAGHVVDIGPRSDDIVERPQMVIPGITLSLVESRTAGALGTPPVTANLDVLGSVRVVLK